jgi:hypothetical protein
VGASITINPGTAGMNGTSSSREDNPDVDDPEYSLKQETTEFLTQLSQSLSDENDNLIGLARSTLMTLKELQGIPLAQLQEDSEGLSTIGEEDESTRQGMLPALPTNYETLATDMDSVLENLKTLLTNPNFVSVEEVEMREEEIVKLRAGWEKMETRFRDTLTLMDGWRRRMADGDYTINLEDLKMGLGLSVGLETFNKDEPSMITEDDDEGASSGFDEDVDAEELEDPPTPEPDDIPDKQSDSDLFKLKLQPDQPALKEASGNVKSPIKSPRKVAFSASIPNTPSELADENVNADALELESVGAAKATRPTVASRAARTEERSSRPTSQDSRIPRHVRCDRMADQLVKLASRVTFSSSPIDSDLTDTALYTDGSQAKKRLSSPHAHPEERSPKLTVQDKLKKAQAEAEAAAVADGLKAVKAEGSKTDADDGERKNRRRSSPMKTRITGRPKRRKSTLTPEELQNLLGCD